MDALRSVLQPITHNLPKPIEDLGKSLITPACYKTLLLDIDPSHTECLKLAISKGLGIGIIGASSVVKVPQLLKLINSQSAEGLSFTSYLLESSAYLISLSYNVRNGFPFSTYGETALILIQNIAIASLVLKYSGNGLGIAGWVGGLIAAGSALFNEQWVGAERLSLLQATAGVLGVASKVPQILTIWQEGGTGQLSAFAVVNYLLGSLTRIFTTLQEVDDPLILYGFVAGFVLNLILFLQVVYYWNAPTSKNTKSNKLEKPIARDGKETARAVASGSAPSYANAAGKSPSTRRRG
ncbi:mannose-P-dolichol utilization defect 1-like protein [Parastagonospora nodorum]|nr:mannose-P-dolichol utilization defect 1-like protein [Parastagonospora nodorum]KAH4032841.1 mannose-P-dolichol utilization defect 1-like protein [Parastagonospora nodorum]KAH4072744.1 mannose-P-dolichol utilization defect 1-like protein [Parastagonospora nodorum]KAH4099105.1 mannose-P-dolichol utilization defect 1-like protein [Parastagonospora nodorum]KAH4111258.1 mannose-P-dolichol utilization defect 1-like protein [Parastagonospora nodorum]